MTDTSLKQKRPLQETNQGQMLLPNSVLSPHVDDVGRHDEALLPRRSGCRLTSAPCLPHSPRSFNVPSLVAVVSKPVIVFCQQSFSAFLCRVELSVLSNEICQCYRRLLFEKTGHSRQLVNPRITLSTIGVRDLLFIHPSFPSRTSSRQ